MQIRCIQCNQFFNVSKNHTTNTRKLREHRHNKHQGLFQLKLIHVLDRRPPIPL